MLHVARKPMTLLGTSYSSGDVVPLERLNPARRRQLVELRRVVPHVVEVAADAQIAEPVSQADGVKVEIAAQDIQCKAESATTGKRCKHDATGDGLCKIHRNALARRASNESTEG